MGLRLKNPTPPPPPKCLPPPPPSQILVPVDLYARSPEISSHTRDSRVCSGVCRDSPALRHTSLPSPDQGTLNQRTHLSVQQLLPAPFLFSLSSVEIHLRRTGLVNLCFSICSRPSSLCLHRLASSRIIITYFGHHQNHQHSISTSVSDSHTIINHGGGKWIPADSGRKERARQDVSGEIKTGGIRL